MRNLVWKEIIFLLINSVSNTAYKSIIINMATVLTFDVMSNKYNVLK
jgi:hypothetical protein